MCKRGGLLISYRYDEHRALVVDADCDSWKCEECKQRLKDRWLLHTQHGARMLMDEGVKLYFATITSHEENRTFAAGAFVFPDAWKKLHKRLNKTGDVHEYIMLPERHKDNALHVHAIWTYPVTTRWLKDNGRECGFGFMNSVGRKDHEDEEIRTVFQVGRYVAKYLSKQLGDDAPKRFRRIRTSEGWQKMPLPNTGEGNYDWHYIGGNGALNAAYDECERAHLTMIDIRTGEAFEDVDLGTIVANNYT